VTRFLISVSFLTLPCALHAQDAGEIIVTATGFETARTDSGHAISMITSDDLIRTQAATINDVLVTIPGVSVAQRGATGAQSSVFVRGGNSSQTLVMIDGVRVNDPASPNGAFDFGALTSGNIERVEVLRGANSIIWGSQAIGGIVNIRNAAPGDELRVAARAEYGSHDTANASANVSGRAGPVQLSAGGSLYRTDGISAIRAGTERDGYRNATANTRALVRLADGISLDLRGYYTKGRVQYDAQFAATPDTLSESRDRTWTGYAGLNADLFNGRFRNRIAYTRTAIRRIGSDPETPVLFTNYNIFRASGQIERFEYRGSHDLSRVVGLVFGVEHEKSRASTFFPANGGISPDRARTKATSGYAQLELKPAAGLTLNTGVRHDDLDSYGKRTSLGGNAAWSLNDGTTVLRASYSEGFRAPTLTEALLPFGNPALKAETAKSMDAGVEQWLLDKRIMLGLTAFRRTSRNQITYNFATFQSENVEQVKASGVEAELVLKPTERLRLSAQYALVNARDVSLDKRLERRPQHRASVALDWTSPIGLALGGTLVLAGDSFENRGNNVRMDGYALSSVRASYPITGAISLYGRVENLFDTAYETVRGYGTLGRTAFMGVRAAF
jgi:vitamin B12 transporter